MEDEERLLTLWRTQLRSHVLILLDEQAGVVAALGGVEEVLGYRADELVGQPLQRIFTAEDRALDLDLHEVVTARARATPSMTAGMSARTARASGSTAC